MATKFTGGPGAGTFSSNTIQKSIFWIVLAAVGALILIMLAIAFHSSGDEAKTGGQKNTSSSPTSGFFEANTVEWKGVTCMDPTKKMGMSILTDNVYVWVRLDRDDRRIYNLPPRNVPEFKTLRVGTFNTMEYKIPKGQKDSQGKEITSAPVGWEIGPRLPD